MQGRLAVVVCNLKAAKMGMYVYTYACLGMYVYVGMYVFTYICMYVCMYVCMYLRMYVCMYVCIYVQYILYTCVRNLVRLSNLSITARPTIHLPP